MNFDDILVFLKTYWQQFVDVAAIVISVIICLIRKRPVYNQMDLIKEDITSVLPVLINQVEHPGDGAEKKKVVIDTVIAYLRKKYHLSSTQDIIDYISDKIEAFLSTPKKGE